MNDRTTQVVIVDDEPQITELLITYIHSLHGDFNVHAFNDPEEARAYLLQHAADVLLTDFKMPKFDGIQLMKLMPAESVKILISGYVSEAIENELRALKASCLEKPVTLKQLGALISKTKIRENSGPCGR